MRKPVQKVVAVLALGLVLLGACSKKSDDSSTDTTSTTAASSTTSSKVTPTTKATTGTTGGGTTSGTAKVDETAKDVTWSLTVTDYRGQNGKLVAFDCPADGAASSVWGTGTFTDDSSVCTAAVYEGLITFRDGGRIVARIEPGQASYQGGTHNGVTSNDYGSWDGSFTFVR
jgi:hypothetical protein